MKSPWSVTGLCSCSGKESTAKTLGLAPSNTGGGTSYTMRCTSCGMARKPLGQAPLAWAKATWVRWLALSVFWPSQQLWNLNVRTT